MRWDDTSQALLKRIVLNIINHPNQDKYRRLNLHNKQLQCLLSQPDSDQVLNKLGFIEDQDHLVHPPKNWDRLKMCQEILVV